MGRDFFVAWYYIPMLLVGTVFLGISNYYGAIYASAKANFLEIKSTIICASSNILMNFLLIPRFNILGAVIATALSYVIVVVVRIIDAKKIIKIKNPSTEVLLQGMLLLGEVFFVMKNMMIQANLFGSCLIMLNLVKLYRKGYINVVLKRLKR